MKSVIIYRPQSEQARAVEAFVHDIARQENIEFELIDVDGSIITESDKIGELVYYGDNVTLGYAECIEDLAKGDDNKGRLETGDMAIRDKDLLFITLQ